MLSGSVCFGVGPESGNTEYRPAGVKIAEHLGVGPEKHIIGELITPGILCDNAKAEAVIRVFAGIGSQITHVQIFLVEIATDFAPECGLKGMFTLPQFTLEAVSLSLTMNRSSGERPVNSPV